MEALSACRLVVLRADYRGGLVVESVVGPQWEPGGWTAFALIWKGHIVMFEVLELEVLEAVDVEAFLTRENPKLQRP